MGLSGLFRPEAGAIAIVFVAGACLVNGNDREKVMSLAASSVPSIGWCIICAIYGRGLLQDWNFMVLPKFGQVTYAALAVAKALIIYVIPIAAMIWLSSPVCMAASWLAIMNALLPMMLLLFAIPLACGFYISPYADWMIDNTVFRLVWCVSVIPISELLMLSKRVSS